MSPHYIARLDGLGVVRLTGPDARGLLQGQLSNDLDRLGIDTPLLAGLHNPQGRVIAILRLLAGPDGGVLAVLPQGLAPLVATRLKRFVLRAKVVIEDCSDSHAVYGLQEGEQRSLQVLGPGQPAPEGIAMTAADWQARDIALGLPQVYPATSEQFVAQMLNLDLVEGISFTKGCYTGQEIIARAHYRGKVKRRLQRFHTTDASPLKPGDRFRLVDGRTIEVIDAVALPAGGHDLLAVAPLLAPTAEGENALDPAGLPLLQTEAAALPYDLPDA